MDTKIRSSIITIIAIIGVVVMESIALCHGIDGTLFMASVGAVCGLGGYYLYPIVKRGR